MVESGLITGLVISIFFNVFCLLFLWLGWDGVVFRYNKFKMKRGGTEATLYVTKNNIIKIIFTKIKGSETALKLKGGLYARTPASYLIYWYKGLPLKIRRDNDPEEVDLWAKDNASGMTAKELDNVVNEQVADGLLAMLKMYFPIVLVITALLIGFTLFAIYFNYTIYENMKILGGDLVKFIPESVRM